MIPSSWFRRLILALFILEVIGAMMWLASRLVENPADRAFAQTCAGIVFLLGYYAGGPLFARFLAPYPSKDEEMQRRLARIAASVSGASPVVLYDHKDQNATAVGIVASQSRVYVTTGLMNAITDEGLRGILAHEAIHVREHHILVTFTYAVTYAFLAHLTDDSRLFLLGFVAFMTLRRYLEYRADAGGAALAGEAAMVQGLRELQTMYPTHRLSRFFNFAAPYPTLAMRIKAVETGRRPLI